MNELIVRTTVVAALIVIFCGCVLLVTLALYGVVRIWARFSALGRNMKEYYWNRRDFMQWKNDFSWWEERKRSKVDTCKRCEYRRRCLEDKEDECCN